MILFTIFFHISLLKLQSEFFNYKQRIQIIKNSMKSFQKQQTLSPRQQLLNQYLTLKPHRAVDRLLQENSLQQCFEIYNLLQQNVKTNTSQLRSVLYSKHQNLHQCSQMIMQISDFASKVKNIQNNIDQLLKKQTIEGNWNKDTNFYNDPIFRIDELMNDKKFSQALQQCGNVLKNPSSGLFDQSQLYYVDFLKVQIVEKLEAYLEKNPLTSQLINQSIKALKKFMQISSLQDLFQYIQNSRNSQSQPLVDIPTSQESTTSILALLYQNYAEATDDCRKYPLSEEQIVEVIFKFKLLTLKNSNQNNLPLDGQQNQQQRVNYLYSKVFHYFSDLLKILQEAQSFGKFNHDKVQKKTEKNTSHSKLYQIFNKNIQKTIDQISELFISDKRKKTLDSQSLSKKQSDHTTILTFQNQLYQKLTNSSQFISILSSLQSHFSSSTENSPQQIITFGILSIIKNLWRDFYHQMLDIITQKINPCSSYKFQLSIAPESLQQLQRFHVIPFQKITKQKLQNYQKEQNLFFNNFIQLLIKSKSNEQKASIVGYFIQLKTKIQNTLKNEVLKLNDEIKNLKNYNNNFLKKKQNEFKIRQILTLFFMTQSYNNTWINNLQNDSQLTSILIHQNETNIESKIFQISVFSTDKNDPSQFDKLFQIFDGYICLSIDFKKLSVSEQIQRWQQEFDKLFGSYHLVVKQNEKLKNDLKQLILALIKTKHQNIENF